MQKSLLVSMFALLAASSITQAKPMKWMDAAGAGLPAGAQMAVLSGNPGKPGMFKVQIKMPANYTVPPHHHPTEEIVRVRSGTLNYGMGDKLDRSNVGALTKGYHVTMAANMNHYVFAAAPVEVQVSGMGPFAITYVDPKDDPRGAK